MEVTAKKVILKNTNEEYLIPYVNPASTTELGTVKIDGETIQISDEGVISAHTHIIGEIISANCSSAYVPDGTLPCDGAEYTQAQFSDLWENYLTGEEITTNVQFYGFYGTGYAASEFTLYATSTTPVIGQIYELVDGKMVLTSYKIAEVGTDYIRLYSGYDAGSGEIVITVNRDETLDVIKDLTTYTNLLNTCSYSEYEADLTTYGQCSKFAVDGTNGTFRVPLIQDTETEVTNNIDYDNGITISASPTADAPFTAPFDGVYIATITYGNHDGVFVVNGVQTAIHHYDLDGGTSITNYIISLSKGDVCYWTNTFNLKASSFYPYKEETKEKLKSFVVVANGQTNQSLMDWSQWASSLQGKMNADHSNDTKPYIVETSDKSILPSWYRVWSDGWCEQGGIATGGTNTTGNTITLIKSFINNQYNLLASVNITDKTTLSNSKNLGVACVNKTTSSFNASTMYGDGTFTAYTFSWQAKGYIS